MGISAPPGRCRGPQNCIHDNVNSEDKAFSYVSFLATTARPIVETIETEEGKTQEIYGGDQESINIVWV